MVELLTESGRVSCVDSVLFYAKKPTPARKGTMSIRKTNSSDYTYLDNRLRADQRGRAKDETAGELHPLRVSDLRRNRSIQATSTARHARPDVPPLRVDPPLPIKQHRSLIQSHSGTVFAEQ